MLRYNENSDDFANISVVKVLDVIFIFISPPQLVDTLGSML